MSAGTYSQLQSITQEYIEPSLADNIFNKTELLQRLRKKQKLQDGGEYIKVPIRYARKDNTGWYSGYDTLLTAHNDTVAAVKYNWAFGYAGMEISWTDELKNSGKSQIVSMLMAEKEAAEETLAYTMTAALFSATADTEAIQGFPLMLDDSSTDYADMNIGDFSGWAASIDETSTTLTMGLLQGKYGDCKDGNEVPTLIISNQDCQDKYWGLLEVRPEFRVQKKNNQLKFQGADWIVDVACPGSGSGTGDNDIEFINENAIKFYTHTRDNFKVTPWQKPVNQEVRIARVKWAGQLTTNNRRRHGAFEAINPAL